jgi:transposase InsO family protein
MDLLLIKRGEAYFKIYIPTSLIGPILAYLHLIGHMGTSKMVDNLKNFFFPHKYSEVKRFVGMCHPCFLTHKSSRRNILGEYPIPTCPFEEVSMDLAENLNMVKGYTYLLIVICVLTDYIIIHPMKSKTSSELAHIFMYSVFQSFNIRRVHSDNGPAFRINIKVIDSSANNPSSRGKAERTVQQVKLSQLRIRATFRHPQFATLEQARVELEPNLGRTCGTL